MGRLKYSKERHFGLAEIMAVAADIFCYPSDFDWISAKFSGMVTGILKWLPINNM